MTFDDIEEMIRKYLSTGVAVVIILVSPTTHAGDAAKPGDPNAVVIPEPGSPPTSETSPPTTEPAPDNSEAPDAKPEPAEPSATDEPDGSGYKPPGTESRSGSNGANSDSSGGDSSGGDAPAPGSDVSSDAGGTGGGDTAAPDTSSDSSSGDSKSDDAKDESKDDSESEDSKDDSKSDKSEDSTSDDSKDESSSEESTSDSKDDSSGGDSVSTSSESSSSDPGSSSDSAAIDPAGAAPQNPPPANPAPAAPAPHNPAPHNPAPHNPAPHNPAPAPDNPSPGDAAPGSPVRADQDPSVTASASATAGGVTASSSVSSGPAANGNAPAPAVPAAPAPAPVTAAERLGWGAPKLQDDFSAGLDRWKVYTGTGHDGKGKRSPSAIAIKDGILTISGDQSGTTGGLSLTPGQKYGRWEARVRTPAADPSYNAVMLLWPDADNFPVGGEIDFMELSDPTRQSAGMFIHHGANNQQVNGQIKIDATQWHNWAVEWTPEAITGYVDGKEWFRNTDTATFPPGPMHLCIQLDWFPNGAGNPKPSTMQVDWIRQYAHDGSGTGKPADAATAASASDKGTSPDAPAQPVAESARRMFSLR